MEFGAQCIRQILKTAVFKIVVNKKQFTVPGAGNIFTVQNVILSITLWIFFLVGQQNDLKLCNFGLNIAPYGKYRKKRIPWINSTKNHSRTYPNNLELLEHMPFRSSLWPDTQPVPKLLVACGIFIEQNIQSSGDRINRIVVASKGIF